MRFRRLWPVNLAALALSLVTAIPADAQLNARYLCLDGSNDYASAPDHATLDVGTGANDDFTLETFFYVPDTSNTSTDTLIWKQGAYGVYIIYNFSLAQGADRFIFRIWTGADYVFLYADTNLAAGWHHVAAIWDNENTATWDYMAMYADGTLIASGSNIEITPGVPNTTSPFQLGAYAGTNPAVGGIEETRISDVVRYSGGSFTVPSSAFTPDANTRALWHFDALPGATSFADSSGNGNTLTGINGAQTCGVGCSTITLAPSTLPDGQHGVSYDQTLTASGGTAPYGFAVTSGTLPPGLSLSPAGVLSGSPSVAGTYGFTVTATDDSTCTGSQGYTVTIAISCAAITVTPATLANGVVGTAYNATLAATGGTPAYTFAVTAGTLPPGLTLAANGSLSGTPSASGNSNFTVTATDSLGCTGARSYSLSMACPPIAVTPATLPAGVIGVAYNATLGATGGTAGYSFAVTLGALPPGVTLASNGTLSGTPTSNGSYDFTVTATDAFSCIGSRAYSVQVAPRSVTVSPTVLEVSEPASTANFTVVLGSAPSGNVVIDLASNDTTEATVSHAQLTFTTANWSTAQTVTVTAANDALIDGEQTATIVVTMNVAATADASWHSVNPADVSVTVHDDEGLRIVATNPAANARAASRTANVEATANDTILASTVTATSFRVHGSQSGRQGGTTSASGVSFQLDSAASFKPGETVQVTATAAITNSGSIPLRPRVWQFTAAAAASPGAMRPHPTTPAVGAGHSFGIALGDIDGDGDVDALVANYSEATDVWVNDGNGSFSPHPTAPTFDSTESERVLLGDLDNDGDLDAIVCRRYGLLYVWMNNGAGVFTPHASIPSFGANNPIDIVLGDLDADGDQDAVVVHFLPSPSAATTWLDGGTGNFIAGPTFGTPANGQGAALGDLDGDGDLDTVLANANGEAETVWLNGGAATFFAHPTTPQFGAQDSRAVALGDLDGDGDLDAVVANVIGNETVWRNDGGGNFSPHPTTPSFDAGYETRAVAFGDIDGDGDLDAAFADWAGGSDPARVWRNDGAANFSALGNYSTTYTADLGLADLDGDGDLDMMTAHSFSNSEKVWINGAPGILVTPTSGLHTTEAGGTATFSIALASYPMSQVSIQVQTSSPNEGRLTYEIGPTQTVAVAFGTSDWNVPKTITITGFDDSIDDGDVAYTITTAPATSSDPLYNGLNAADVSVVNRDDEGPPSFLTATATSASQVTLSWGAVSGAASYEVHRATAKSGPFSLVGTPAGTTFNDSVSANTTYIHKVRRSGGSAADFSPIDIATTVAFTDPVLTGLPMRGVHIEQLRTAVNAVRAAAELAPAASTDAAPLAGKTVKRVHLVELRIALDAARTSLGVPAIAYGEGITAQATTVKRAHVEELRAGTQ